MRFSGARRPYGVAFKQPTNVRAKGIMQVHKSTDPPTAWTNCWGANFDWNGWLRPGLDIVASLGCTAVKISPPVRALATGGATAALAGDRLRRYCDYAATKGLNLYWSLSYDQSDATTLTTTQRSTAAVALATVANEYPTFGIDLFNEPDAIGATSQANVAAYASVVFPAVRAVTRIPLTISLSGLPVQWAGHPYLSTISPYVDFYDWHTYVTGANLVPTIPADLTAWRASSSFKPYALGEAGNPLVTGSGFTGGSGFQTTVYNAIGQIGAQPDCLGVFAFCLTDYDGSQFGFLDETLNSAVLRSQITGPFASWIGTR